MGDVREQRRADEEAARGQLTCRLVDVGTFGDAGFHQLLDLGQLRGVVDRPDVGVLVHRVADTEGGKAILEAPDELVRDRFLDEQPATGAADLALVEEDAVDDALDGLVERCVVKDDVGGLAAEFERQRLVTAGQRPADGLADHGRAREGDFVDVGMADEREPDLAGPGDDVDDAGGQVRLAAHVGEEERGQRGR